MISGMPAARSAYRTAMPEQLSSAAIPATPRSGPVGEGRQLGPAVVDPLTYCSEWSETSGCHRVAGKVRGPRRDTAGRHPLLRAGRSFPGSDYCQPRSMTP